MIKPLTPKEERAKVEYLHEVLCWIDGYCHQPECGKCNEKIRKMKLLTDWLASFPKELRND